MKSSAAVPDCTAYVDRFAAYCAHHPAWGIFHTCMDDGNWRAECADPNTEEERELAEIFARLSPSQRKKVRDLAEEAVRG